MYFSCMIQTSDYINLNRGTVNFFKLALSDKIAKFPSHTCSRMSRMECVYHSA